MKYTHAEGKLYVEDFSNSVSLPREVPDKCSAEILGYVSIVERKTKIHI